MTVVSSTVDEVALTSDKPGAASVTISYSINAVEEWAIVGASLKPAVADVPYALNTTSGGEFLVIDSSGVRDDVSASGNINDDVWHYVTSTYDGSAMSWYTDGAFSLNDTNYSGNVPTNTNGLLIGADYLSPASGYFTGAMDEVRVASSARTAQWISTEHNNQTDASLFYSIGSQEVPSGGGGGATFAAAQDTALSGLTKNTTKRLRFEISNEGTVTSGSVKYRLEVSEANPPSSLCASATTWTRVGSSSHWGMAASTYIADGESTADIDPGDQKLFNENTTFVSGELKDATDETTAGITLTTSEFTELEYAIAATNSATGSGTYCFRLTGEGSITDFGYSETKYGKVTLGPDLDFGFRKPITIDRSKIPVGCGTTLLNFPLLFSVTDLDLSTVSGQVTDAEGDDIIFRALDDATCGGVGTAPCTLDHEMESYNATTGVVVAWVRLPSVKTAHTDNTTDTQIYVYYGNGDITTSTENVNGGLGCELQGVCGTSTRIRLWQELMESRIQPPKGIMELILAAWITQIG